MPCDARNGPQARIEDSGDTNPGTTTTEANGGSAPTGTCRVCVPYCGPSRRPVPMVSTSKGPSFVADSVVGASPRIKPAPGAGVSGGGAAPSSSPGGVAAPLPSDEPDVGGRLTDGLLSLEPLGVGLVTGAPALEPPSGAEGSVGTGFEPSVPGVGATGVLVVPSASRASGSDGAEHAASSKHALANPSSDRN